jgi:hypothetical protein
MLNINVIDLLGDKNVYDLKVCDTCSYDLLMGRQMMREMGRCGKNLIIRVKISDESGRQQRNYVLQHGLESLFHKVI